MLNCFCKPCDRFTWGWWVRENGRTDLGKTESGEGSDVTWKQEEQNNQVEQAYLAPGSQRWEFCKTDDSHFLLSLNTFYIVPPLLSYLHLSSEEQLQVHWSFALLLKMKTTNYSLFNIFHPHTQKHTFITFIF